MMIDRIMLPNDGRGHLPVEFHGGSDSKRLYIFFGGIAAGITMPPFEFYKTSQIIDCNKVFIRDVRQCWYQDGLPGIGDDVLSIASFVRGLIDQFSPEEVFFVGNSMGGYAALLFASYVGRGNVVAFSPQTFISPTLRFFYRDFRWMREVTRTYYKTILKKRIFDIRGVMIDNSKLQVSIYVSKDYRLDWIHAKRMRGLKNVTLHQVNGCGHNVVRYLKDKGDLPYVMSGAHGKLR